MEKYFDVLRKCALFERIDDSGLAAMLSCVGARVLSFGKRETIIAEGDPARDIGIVLLGRAQILRVDYFGNRSIISDVAPAQMFCESFACAALEAVPVSVVATTPCEIMLVNCTRLMRSCANACEFHQQMIYNLVRDVATKNIMFHQKLEITSKRSTRGKLMAYLLLQAKQHDSSSFSIPFDRQELADYLEVDRSGLSAEIGKMRREGIIESEKNRFTLIGPEFESSL